MQIDPGAALGADLDVPIEAGGSAAIQSPVGALAQLASHGSRGFPALLTAQTRTDAALLDKQQELSGVTLDPGTSIVLMGSWGRRELTSGSDDDFIVLVEGAEREGVSPSIASLDGLIGTGEAKPGTQGVFGNQVFTQPLLEHIGLDDDSNSNLTRRMLLVLESLPVAGRDAYLQAFGQVIDGYVGDQQKNYRPPRFLLNDLIRYWRTICVDFASKQKMDEAKWGLRSAKLRLNRKLLFAGGLVPVLLCHLYPAHQQRDFLITQLQAPPADRLAAAFEICGARDAGMRALGAYDRWIEMLGDPGSRAHLAALTASEAREDQIFNDVRRLATELENGLLALLFETRLRPLVREFGIF